MNAGFNVLKKKYVSVGALSSLLEEVSSKQTIHILNRMSVPFRSV